MQFLSAVIQINAEIIKYVEARKNKNTKSPCHNDQHIVSTMAAEKGSRKAKMCNIMTNYLSSTSDDTEFLVIGDLQSF